MDKLEHGSFRPSSGCYEYNDAHALWILKRPCDFISVTSKNDITSLYPRKYEGIKRLIKALLDFHGKKTRTFLEKKNTSILEELLFVYLPLITIHYACYVEFFPNVSNCLKRFLSSLIKCIGSLRTLALFLWAVVPSFPFWAALNVLIHRKHWSRFPEAAAGYCRLHDDRGALKEHVGLENGNNCSRTHN